MKEKKYVCWNCNKPIPEERLAFLLESGMLPVNFACVQHSTTGRIKGIYLGEHGTSEMKLCDKVYDDSVRAKFAEVEEIEEEPGESVD